MNVAVSADGKLALPDGSPLRLSGAEDHERVHGLRAEADAILVGVGTVLSDDPHLTARPGGEILPRREQPLRVVLDTRGRTPPDARVLDDAAPTLLLTGSRDAAVEGADTVVCGGDPVDLHAAFRALEARGVDRVLVEGGGTVIASLLEAGLVDRLSVYVASVIVGGKGPTLAGGAGARIAEDVRRLDLRSVERVGEGVLLTYGGPGP